MRPLISVNCPVCRRPYVLRVDLEQLRETRPHALCARCGQRFDLLELVEKASRKSEVARPFFSSTNERRTAGGLTKKVPTISERTPPPTMAQEVSAKPGVYRATVDRDAVRRARLRTRTREEIRRALSLPEVQAVSAKPSRTTLPWVGDNDAEEMPPSSSAVAQALADLDRPFPWLDAADPGLAALAPYGQTCSTIIESLLTPAGDDAAEEQDLTQE